MISVRFWRMWCLALTGCALFVCISAALLETKRTGVTGDAIAALVRDPEWHAVRAEVEVVKLVAALNVYAADPNKEHFKSLERASDVVWSRLSVMPYGYVYPLLEVEHAQLMEAAQSLMNQLDQAVGQGPDAIIASGLHAEFDSLLGAVNYYAMRTAQISGEEDQALTDAMTELVRRTFWITAAALACAVGFVCLLAGEFWRLRVKLQHTWRTIHTVQHLAHHDPLTGLPNRRLFEKKLKAAIRRQLETGEGFALHLIDLDRFKSVNDRFGHSTGDALLCEVSTRMRLCTGKNGIVARLAGDEFVVLQKGSPSEHTARTLAHQLADAIRAVGKVNNKPIGCSASIGSLLVVDTGGDVCTLLEAADSALYSAKRSAGVGIVVITNAGWSRAA